MLSKVLIANRGEIACRIVRTARRMGLRTVAVVSEADRGAMHADMADEVVEIGPAPSADSYLRIDRIIAAARQTGSDCIHPGYGFLSENPALAEACGETSIKFIGPSPDAMHRMGGKAEAKAIAEAAGVPVVPGYRGTAQGVMALAKEARAIGFPIMIKAVAGGGGRGMRLVERESDFAEALESAQREAMGAFGDSRMLLEKFVERPRHIEVQVFGDSHGNVVHLFERDCSLQRRNQKVIEEAPAPGMSAKLREAITGAAIACAKAVRYEGAGTVEFLVEGGGLGPDARWYFIEMNTRLQVEHPVTEAVTGLDLVEWQLRIAGGERLPLSQDQIRCEGHSVEARLYAEDPAHGFRPSTGRLVAFEVPIAPGLRVDTGVRTEDVISPYYDPMIAKLITHGATREEAFTRLSHALASSVALGPRTNAAFLKALVDHGDVRAARLDTSLIGRDIDRLVDAALDREAVACGVSGLLASDRESSASRTSGPWDRNDAFQLGGVRQLQRPVVVDGAEHRVGITWGDGLEVVTVDGEPVRLSSVTQCLGHFDRERVHVLHEARQTILSWPVYDVDALDDGASRDLIRAPINGRLARIFVRAEQHVAKGDRIAMVEAMKMEHLLQAPRDGTISRLPIAEGQQVSEGVVLAELEPESSE